MIQFYAPDILQTLTLPESESAHCSRVLRMKEGDEAYVTDGKGRRYRCVIMEPHQKHTSLEILDFEEVPNHWPCRITLAVAPTKHSDRMEWLLEKAVEIGVDNVALLRCQRSERKSMKLDRLEKVMVSAMKQSLKGVMPEIEEVTSFKSFVESAPSESMKYFGYCSKDYPRKDFSREYRAGTEVVIMIGPEGDFTHEEVELAVASGFVPVTFGESRLRTETAALYAVTAVHVLNQLKFSQ